MSNEVTILRLDPRNKILKEAVSKKLDELHRQLGTPKMRDLSRAQLLEMYPHLYLEMIIMRLLANSTVSSEEVYAELEPIEGFNDWRLLDALEFAQELLQGRQPDRM